MSGTTEELGRARQAASEPKASPDDTLAEFSRPGEIDLALVEKRLRLKAASCRLFIKKRGSAADPLAELETRRQMNEMIAQAKAMPSCFLWVFWRERPQADDSTLAQIAENYEANADAVALMRKADALGEGARCDECIIALNILAEANSALRVVMAKTWLSADDNDQAEIHTWLRKETYSRRVLIERFMTADDPADPANAADVRSRISIANQRFDDRAAKAKGVKSALSQIKFHAGQITKNDSHDASGHWGKIEDAVARLFTMGVSPTDRRIAEAVGPKAAALWPAAAPDSAAMAVVIERVKMLAAAADGTPAAGGVATTRQWSDAVLEVRDLLRDKKIVVIGGERKAEAVERFVEAFALLDVEWVALTEHGSSSPMQAPIFRPATAVVLLIIKLAGHLHADNAREFAAAAGKPLVLLTGGYNPEQAAKAILDQASTRLKQ